jgi:hypothetical protein
MPESESWYRDVNITQHRPELVLIYFGSSTCSPCIDPGFKVALARLKAVVADLARSEHRTFRSIGVSIDWELDAGVKFLSECGPWNEIVVGNNWYNSAVTEHFWNQAGSDAALPQVLIVARSFNVSGNRYVPGPKSYLVRLIGKLEVDNWTAMASSGAGSG